MDKYCTVCFLLFKEGECQDVSLGTLGIATSIRFHPNCILGWRRPDG